MRYLSETVDDYMDEVEPQHRAAIKQLREQAKRVLPRYTESMRLRMPTYEKEGKVYAYTRQKHNFSIYVNNPELVLKHKPRLGKASYGKNCIRYKNHEEIVWDALEELLREAY